MAQRKRNSQKRRTRNRSAGTAASSSGPASRSAPAGRSGKKRKTNSLWKTIKRVVPTGAAVLADTFYPGTGFAARDITSSAMDYFGKITGWGDYHISKNSIMSGDQGLKPKFGDSNYRVRDTEFVRFVVTPSTTSFTPILNLHINPSNPVLFPKLSIKAGQYQKWVCHGMIIYLDSTCSEAITTAATGNMSIPTLMAVTTYNMIEKQPANSSSLLNSFFANSNRVNKDLVHPIECDPAQRAMEIMFTWAGRPLDLQARDPRFENLGKFFLATQGGQQTTAFQSHTMRIEYDIELIQPIVHTQLDVVDHYEQTAITGVLESDWVIQTSSTTYGNPQKPYTFSANRITFDESVYGAYRIGIVGVYTVGSPGFMVIPTPGGNCSALNVINNDTSPGYSTNGAALTFHQLSYHFMVNGGGYVDIPAMGAANFSRADIFIESMEELSN